jgi:hypothetical protein
MHEPLAGTEPEGHADTHTCVRLQILDAHSLPATQCWPSSRRQDPLTGVVPDGHWHALVLEFHTEVGGVVHAHATLPNPALVAPLAHGVQRA